MTNDAQCPYCNTWQEINHDDGYGLSEDVHHQQCVECDKYFIYTTCISMSYDTDKADCLNDGKHQFEKTITYPPEYARMQCTVCGEYE